MTQDEIFNKLKEALNYEYLSDCLTDSEITNVEDYLENIRNCRELEREPNERCTDEFNTYREFIKYLSEEAIGNIKELIDCFNENSCNIFQGYKEVTKELINRELFITFENKGIKYKAKWQAVDNYASWQKCGYSGDDYSGYLLFPTHNDNKYFCLWFEC